MPDLDFDGLREQARAAFKPHYADVVRRAGRRRRNVRAALAVATLAAAVAVPAFAGSLPEPFRGTRPPNAGQAGTSPSATPVTSANLPPFEPAVVAPTDLGHLRGLPADAKLRTPYPFDLYAHCGIELAGFAGSAWRADQPIHNGLPGYIAGTMELLDADTARFVIDRRHFDAPVDFVIFHRTAASVPLCK